MAYTKGSYPTQYIKNVQKPICHECAEILVDLGPTPEEIQAASEMHEAKIRETISTTKWFFKLSFGCLGVLVLYVAISSFFVAIF